MAPVVTFTDYCKSCDIYRILKNIRNVITCERLNDIRDNGWVIFFLSLKVNRETKVDQILKSTKNLAVFTYLTY